MKTGMALVLGLLVLPLAVPHGVGHDLPVVPAGHEPRSSIVIEGDDQFTRENGVRGGSGTPDDPYRIESWLILPTHGHALRIVNTTAHVRIANVLVEPVNAALPGPARACVTGAGTCGPGIGVDVIGARNVSLVDVAVHVSSVALRVSGSSDVSVDGARLGTRAASALPGHAALQVLESERVTVRNLTTGRVLFPLILKSVTDVTIADSTFEGPGIAHVGENLRVSIHRNAFHRVTLAFQEEANDVLVADNAFTGAHPGLRGAAIHYAPEFGAVVVPDALTVCRNVFAGSDHGLYLSGVHRARIVGNTFTGNAHAIDLLGYDRENTTIEVSHNGFRDNGAGISLLARAVVNHNNFDRNGDGHWLYNASGSDATLNWWGDASGPSGEGPGAGDPVFGRARLGLPPITPWLTAPAPLDAPCDRIEAWPRPPEVPTRTIRHAFEGNVAGAVILDFHDRTAYRIAVTYELTDAGENDMALASYRFHPDDPRGGSLWGSTGALHALAEVDASHGDARVEAYPSGVLRAWFSQGVPETWGRSHDKGFLFMAGASRGIARTTFELTLEGPEDAVDVTWVFSNRTGLLTAREMAEGRDHAIARARGTGLAVVDGGEAAVRVTDTLYGFSRYRTYDGVDEHAFRVDTPRGSRPADALAFIGEPPGEYVFHLDQRGAGGSGGAFVLHADIRLPPRAGTSDARAS